MTTGNIAFYFGEFYSVCSFSTLLALIKQDKR